MSRTRAGLLRVVGLGVGLALALSLLVTAEATAAKYAVAQCGWHVGADADWADSTGGAKFRPSSYCAAPPGADPFDGVHLKSFTRGGPTVSGTRFARWRWTAPPATGITRVSGTWWHALHDGMQQRIGAGTLSGGFAPFAVAGRTDVTPRSFVAGFSPAAPAIEDRLLCARAASKWCSIDPGSFSAVRALTFTIEDGTVPGAGIGGDILAGGWRRGVQAATIWGADSGSGIRFGETLLDGARVALTEYPCAKASIGGEWRGTRMRPCELGVSGSQAIATAAFSDSPHDLVHCVVDFAGNRGCDRSREVRIDNNPPAHPRNLELEGGDGWRRVNDFDLEWDNPSQGRASRIGGAGWRIVGPAGYDGGPRFSSGRDRSSLRDLRLPRPGAFSARVWLRDEAGNERSSSAVSVPLRYDNVRPGVAFAPQRGPGLPGAVRADVADLHSGPASGTIHYRGVGAKRWIQLPAKLAQEDEPGAARLTAPLPGDLEPGTYVFRATATDAAGNATTTNRRADGTEMALRKAPPPPAKRRATIAAGPAPARAGGRAKAKTRVFARLRWRRRRGQRVTVPFGAGAALAGRLVNAEGAGLARRRLRVVSRASRGAFARKRVEVVRTGRRGGFRLPLRRGPSRRITVTFRGGPGLARARRSALALRVRGGAVLHAAPRKLRNGSAVRLWGRVRARGAPLPRRGKLVAVQYFESAARRWRPVLVTRSDHSGRFRARYRFRYVSRRARIRLRAVALAEERWPYAPGASRPVIVRVRG